MAIKINFHLEEITYTLKNKTKVKNWINNCILKENYSLTELNIIFCSDEGLLKINKEYLDHDYYTDIITFDNSETENEIEGDLFISLDRIKDNAQKIGTEFTTELHRVIIHGVLHLLGYKDKTKEEQNEMQKKEDEYLDLREL